MIIAFGFRQLLSLLLTVAIVCFVAGVSAAHIAAPTEPSTAACAAETPPTC